MYKKIIALSTLCFLLTGCYMIPMAFIGPATSGWTTASIAQSAITASGNYLIKKSTGKTISEHVFEQLDKDTLKSTYLPQKKKALILPKAKPML